MEHATIWRRAPSDYLSGPNPNAYDILWNDEATKGFHFAGLMQMSLGFDMLFFEPLDDRIFLLKAQRSALSIGFSDYYNRHHKDPDEKWSMYLVDLVLTTLKRHSAYKSLSVEYQDALTEGFEKLIAMDNKITEADIEEVFKDNLWIYKKWSEDANFAKSLKEFSERKDFLNQYGIDAFLKEYYEIGYERFFGQYGTTVYEMQCHSYGGYLGDF